MSSLLVFVLLLFLSVAGCVSLTSVYEWGDKEVDYSWPSEEIKAKAVQDGTFQPANFYPRYSAVHKQRLFLSLGNFLGIPVTLVSLPTGSSSTPKLDPFPNWDLHKNNSCDSIVLSKGLHVDSAGRLWVVDDGSDLCKAKLRIFNLEKEDAVEHVHEFPDAVVTHDFAKRELRDVVVDETPTDALAYIADAMEQHVVVFSLRSKASRAVRTTALRPVSLALAPRRADDGRLYLAARGSDRLYALPVAQLRADTPTATLELVGKWRQKPYRVLIDASGTLYAAFLHHFYVSTWNVTQPFAEQTFYEAGPLGVSWPFTLALDATGTLWSMEKNFNRGKPTHRLLHWRL